MNLSYFLILVLYAFVFQIPCFISLLFCFPMHLITGHRRFLDVSHKLMMCALKWIDHIFFKINHIGYDSVCLSKQENTKKRYIYLANHQSFMDAIIARKITMSWQYLVTIVISYTKFIPFVGPNLWMLRIPFYDYHAGINRKAQLKALEIKTNMCTNTDSESQDSTNSIKSINSTDSQPLNESEEEKEKRIAKINGKRAGLVKMYTDYLMKNPSAVLAMFPEGKRVFTRKFKLEDIRKGGFVIAKKTGMYIVPMYHNLIDRFDDVNQEYDSSKKIYCLYGTPIDTLDRSIDDVKKEYYDAMVVLESKLNSLINEKSKLD